MTRPAVRWRQLGWGLLVCLVIAHLLFYLALRWHTANRYLAELINTRVPGLTLTIEAGNLAQGLKLAAEYRNTSVHVQLSDVTLQIAPDCLWRAVVCVDYLSAASLAITTTKSEAASTDRVERAPLARVETPVRLQVYRLKLGQLQVGRSPEKSFVLKQLTLSGNWYKDQIRVIRAHFIHPGCQGQLQGQIQLQGFYPLQTRVQCDTDTALGRLSGSFHGDLARLTTADLRSEGNWPLQAEAALSPLDPALTVNANIKLMKPVTIAEQQLRSGELTLSGPFRHLSSTLRVGFNSPRWPGHNVLQLWSDVQWQDETGQLQVDIQRLQGRWLQREISGNGALLWQNGRLHVDALTLRQADNQLQLKGTWESDVNVSAELDVPALQQLWSPLRGSLSGTLAISGAASLPDLRAQLSVRDLGYGDVALGTGRLQLQLAQLGRQPGELKLQLKQLTSGAQTLGNVDFSARGTLTRHQFDAHWRHPHLYNARLNCDSQFATPRHWRGQCAIPGIAAPDWALTGKLAADVLVSGSGDQRRVQGQLKLRDARTQLEHLPQPFEDIELDISIADQTARLDGRFSVDAAPGTLRGTLSRDGPGWQGELQFQVQQLPLQPDENTQITLVPAVTLAIAPQQWQLTGQVDIPRARVRLNQLPAQAVSPSPDTVIVGHSPGGQASAAGPSTSAPAARRTELVRDLTLRLGDDVVFQGFGLDTRLGGQLRLKQAPATGARATGVVQLQKGRYRAYGQDLTIRHGDLIFVGDLDNPQLRVEAVRKMDDESVTVGLRAEGPARQPKISLFSIPEMAQQAKLHYLLTGRAPGTAADTNPDYLAAQTALSLGLSSSDGLVNKTAQALGIDNFRISAESGQQGPEVHLSGYLSSNLLVRYGIGVFEAVNSLTLRYKVGRNLYIEAISGQANSLDLLWSFDRSSTTLAEP